MKKARPIGRWAKLAWLASTAGLAASQAAAESFSLDIGVSHSATPVGRPQKFNNYVLAPGYPPEPATNYDIVYFGQPTSGPFTDSLLATLPVTNGLPDLSSLLGNNYSYSPAKSAFSYSDRISWQNDLEMQSELDGLGSGKHFGNLPSITSDCFRDDFYTQSSNLPRLTNFQQCDAVTIGLTLNQTNIQISAAENSPDVRIVAPAIGLDYSSFSDPNFTFGTRTEGLSNVKDYLVSSGKNIQLANVILGRSAGASFSKGVLPKGGTFFSGALNLSRSSAGTTPAAQFNYEFGFSSLSETLAYVIGNLDAKAADFGLQSFGYRGQCSRLNGALGVAGNSCDAVDVKLSIMGLAATLASSENSPDVTLRIPDINYVFTTSGAEDRNSALSQLRDDFSDAKTKQLFSALAAKLTAVRPDDPLVGNPNSLQGRFTQLSLDIENPSELLDETPKGRAGLDSAGWMVGGRIGTFSSRDSEATFVETLFEKSFRLGEGDRSRLKVSAPFSLISYSEGDPQTTGSARLAYEMPLQQGKWLLEPSASIGYVFETDKLAAGAMWQAGLSTRYKIAPVGRGHIVLGSAIAYSSTIEIESNGYKTPEIENTSFRNAIAYQLPIGDRIFGRLGTVRASYAYTLIEGDKVFLDNYHDISISYGVGTRESSTRQASELLRIGLTGSFGKDYDSYSLNIGFRF